MITAEKPPLEEAYLEHFGIKGMRWGQRSKSGSSNKKMSAKKKVAIGVGVAVGAAAVAFAMTRSGKIPVKQVLGHRPGFSSPSVGTTAARGRSATSNISQSEWKRRVSALRGDIAAGNRDQDSWMRKQGLGAQLNRKTSGVDMGNAADVRRAWNDPNHVWDL